MMRLACPVTSLILAVALGAAGTTACSAILDFDALGNGQSTSGSGSGGSGGGAGGGQSGSSSQSTSSGQGGGGGQGGAVGASGCSASQAVCDAPPCNPDSCWTLACHSVFVQADEKVAYVTRDKRSGEQPPAELSHPYGLFRIDLTEKPSQDGTPLHKSSEDAAKGLASDGVHLVFAEGAVLKLNLMDSPIQVTEVAPGQPYYNPNGVMIASNGDIYSAGMKGVIQHFNAGGTELEDWSFNSTPAYYLAMYGGAPLVTIDDTPGSVQLLGPGKNTTTFIGNLEKPRGITVQDLVPDGGVAKVPHVFIAARDNIRMVWQGPDNMQHKMTFPASDPMAPSSSEPGEIVAGETYVYWTEQYYPGSGSMAEGNVYRIQHHDPKAIRQTLAIHQHNPEGVYLVKSASYDTLYWCGRDGLQRLRFKSMP